ncbi:hypothetical protein MPSEU_000882100 [Mayamaea pseudoterrestris]|nr:hypothetical protein MPSEU_000882100 [Mayamaea pseudoterrestris]
MSVASFDSQATVQEILEQLERNSQSIQTLIIRSVLDDSTVRDFHDAIIDKKRMVSSLQTLELPCNNLSSCSLPLLARILQSAQNLRNVNLSENHLGDACNNQGLELFVDVFTNANIDCHVQTLDLRQNKIGPKGGHALSRLLRHNSSLKSLSLAQNALGTKTIKAIAPSLAQNITLQYLDLSYNKLSDRGISMLVAATFDSLSQSRLASLDLQYNKIGPAGAHVLSKALLNNHNKYLTCLNLSLNCLGPEGAQAFASVLKHSHTLQHLYLSRNDLSTGTLPLLHGLADSQVTRLQLLDLSWNSLKDDVAVYLAEQVLPNNSHLEVLNLASNAISDIGMMALAKALAADLTLRELNIVGNQAKDISALALAEVLTSPHCYLETLHWEKNNFTQAGKRRIQAAIKYRVNVKQWLGKYLKDIRTRKVMAIDISSRRIGDDELIAICRAIAKYKTRVPTLWLFGGGSSNDGKSNVTTDCSNSSDEDDGVHDIQVITSRGITVLAKSVLAKNAGRVERVYIDQFATVSDDGWLALMQALVTNHTVVILSLTKSNVSMTAIKSLAVALQRNVILERLNLSDNKLGDGALLELVQSKFRLKSLNLSRNEISDLGPASLPMLAGNVLQELYLAGNNISDAGALDFAKACIHGTHLQWISLSQNRLTYRGKRALKLFLPEFAILEADEQR